MTKGAYGEGQGRSSVDEEEGEGDRHRDTESEDIYENLTRRKALVKGGFCGVLKYPQQFRRV